MDKEELTEFKNLLKNAKKMKCGITLNKEFAKVLLELINDFERENKELKIQLYSSDQIRVNCPKCGEKIIVNECRTVSDLTEIISKAIGHINACGQELSKDEARYLLEILEGEIK